MSKVTIDQWYKRVNAAWEGITLPVPTPAEAVKGAAKLWTYAIANCPADSPHALYGEFKFEATSGNRYTWLRRSTVYVNPNRKEWGVGGGWQAIAHDIGHCVFRRLNPGVKPHCAAHARLELKLVKRVRSWLEPKPVAETKSPSEEGDVVTVTTDAAEPTVPDPKVERKEKIRKQLEAAEKRWVTRQKRAETYLKKIRRRLRYYR